MTAPGGATQESEPAPRGVYLHPGQLVASSERCTVTTILGSCVAVCLWSPETGVGGMNHFLLPHYAGAGSASPRFGNVAMDQLLGKLLGLGARREGLRARIFGGAGLIKAFRDSAFALGPKNVALARRFLREADVLVVAEDVGGDHGRKITFQTHDGATAVRLLTGGHHGND